MKGNVLMTTAAENIETTETKPAEGLDITEKAADKVREFEKSSPDAKGKSLRVYIQGGGCSGFQYGFAFDDKKDDDMTFEGHGVSVVVDPESYKYVKGSTVDFIDGLTGAGFTVNNPNATSSCGCGTSFTCDTGCD
jgi:iron-sulfur cluster assembly accessory protein